MRFDLDDLNPGKKFYLDDDDQEQGYVCVRVLSPSERNRIARETRREVVKMKRGKPYTTVEIDEDKNGVMIWDYCISDWLIYDSKNKPIPCTAENKVKLMEGSPRFAKLVSGFLEIAAELDATEAEETEKN